MIEYYFAGFLESNESFNTPVFLLKRIFTCEYSFADFLTNILSYNISQFFFRIFFREFLSNTLSRIFFEYSFANFLSNILSRNFLRIFFYEFSFEYSFADFLSNIILRIFLKVMKALMPLYFLSCSKRLEGGFMQYTITFTYYAQCVNKPIESGNKETLWCSSIKSNVLVSLIV